MIKATFKNIGPIKNAELELGDLTVIAGENNTGKTYLVYALYGFLRFWTNTAFPIHRTCKYPKAIDKKIKAIAQQIEKTGTAHIELEEYMVMRDWLIEKASKLFSNEIILQVFNSPYEEFKDAEFQFKETEEKKLKEHEIAIYDAKGGRARVKCLFQDEQLKFKTDTPGSVESSELIEKLHIFIEIMTQSNCVEPFILPAERLGISLFYKELDFTKNRLVEELQNLSDDKHLDPSEFLKKQSARYAMPVKDNIDFTRDIANIKKQKSELKIYQLVQKIMDGYYKSVKDEIRFVSMQRGKNRFDIPLHLASSSARVLSDLYFYLRHRAERLAAEPEQILIIDEPESHLSPTNQILMTRLLAFCINQGLKVLITTHSDYIIKEINNLIMLHNDFKRKKEFLKKHKKDYTENDYLDRNSVKAYICEDGGLTPCDTDEKGIIGMSVFDDAIDKINQISTELCTHIEMDDSNND